MPLRCSVVPFGGCLLAASGVAVVFVQIVGVECVVFVGFLTPTTSRLGNPDSTIYRLYLNSRRTRIFLWLTKKTKVFTAQNESLWKCYE